jgi:hypothetical protein
MTQQLQARSGPAGTQHRPGLVLFSMVMLGTLSAFLVVVSISEWADSFWLYERSFTIAGNHLVVWGFIDFVLACVAAYAAVMLWDGRRIGQVLALVFAGLSGVRWLFYIPADPWLALAILTIDGLVIYGLTAHDEWFSRA